MDHASACPRARNRLRPICRNKDATGNRSAGQGTQWPGSAKEIAEKVSALSIMTAICLACAGMAQAQGSDEGPWPVTAITYGKGVILTSPDGETWTVRSSGTDVPLNAMAYGKGKYAAVGAYGTIITSPAFWNWTKVRSGSQSWLGAIVHARKKFVAVGSDGTILASSDGANWSPKF